MKKSRLLVISIMAAIFAVITSCSNDVPRPRGYFRISLPEKEYETFANDSFPYKFDYANVANIERRGTKDEPYWVDVVYPRLNAKIYCSYKQVNNNFREVNEDARSFVYKHTIKADDITEQPYLDDSAKVYALLYELKGNTASAIQFVATDSVKHFFRGALYFNNTPNQDSVAPVREYIREDIIRLLESLRWK
ncbi:MAG: gliding motility lipoprotein GldD [Paludibacteraceae bacterium]|nr:gliding motility lipoprotein GldD [Paludibacteraceae bacterium]